MKKDPDNAQGLKLLIIRKNLKVNKIRTTKHYCYQIPINLFEPNICHNY